MELLDRIRTLIRRYTTLARVRVRRRWQTWRRSWSARSDVLHYFVEIPAEPGQIRSLLEGDPLIFPLAYPLARINVLLHPEIGDTLPVRLRFEVSTRTPLPAFLALRLYERKIRRQLEHLASHLYFRCLAVALAPPGWNPHLIQTTDFPSLDRRNFRQPGSGVLELRDRFLTWMQAPAHSPARSYFYHYTVQPGYPMTVEQTDVLVIRMAVSADEIEPLLPPPFHLSRTEPACLLLIVAREVAVRRGRLESGRPALRWELRAPVQLLTRSNYLHGWLPLEACRVPLDRWSWPFDSASGSLGSYPEGLRFCAGGPGRRLQYHCVFRPRRGLVEGDGLPTLLAGPTHLFVQDPDSLDIAVLREEPDFPVNRLRLAVDETATFEHHHDTGALPGPADFYGERLGVSLEVPESAFALDRLDSRLRFEFSVRLFDTQYRVRAAGVGNFT